MFCHKKEPFFCLKDNRFLHCNTCKPISDPDFCRSKIPLYLYTIRKRFSFQIIKQNLVGILIQICNDLILEICSENISYYCGFLLKILNSVVGSTHSSMQFQVLVRRYFRCWIKSRYFCWMQNIADFLQKYWQF